MSVGRFSSIALISAVAINASGRPASAAQAGPSYWVCEHATPQSTSTLYLSDVTGPFGPRTAGQ